MIQIVSPDEDGEDVEDEGVDDEGVGESSLLGSEVAPLLVPELASLLDLALATSI